MYFWSIEKLKSQLRVAPLTEREVLPYLMLFIVLTEVGMFIPPQTINVWDYLNFAYGVLLTVIGSLYLYRKNGGDAGSHFFQRFLAVGWVVGIRWLAFALPSFIALSFAMDFPKESNAMASVFMAVATLVLYQRLGHHLADLAAPSSTPPTAQ